MALDFGGMMVVSSRGHYFVPIDYFKQNSYPK
jgi:hypothetical protein